MGETWKVVEEAAAALQSATLKMRDVLPGSVVAATGGLLAAITAHGKTLTPKVKTVEVGDVWAGQGTRSKVSSANGAGPYRRVKFRNLLKGGKEGAERSAYQSTFTSNRTLVERGGKAVP